MGLKDHKLFHMEQISVTNIQGRTNTRQDQLRLTALRTMVDMEPYGSRVLLGDPFDDEPRSLSSASPTENDEPEDPEDRSGKKKKKGRSWRQDRRHSKEAKALATFKIVVSLPEFKGRDHSEFAESFGQFLVR